MPDWNAPRWALIRRRVSVSATPIEAFGKLRLRSTESGSMPTRPANRSQISRLRCLATRQWQHVHPLAREGRRPPLQHTVDVERPPVPDRCGLGCLGEAVVGELRGVAVLDALLPAGGEQPEGLPAGDDEVDLGRRQVGDHPGGLLGRRGGQELVADDRGPRPSRRRRRACAPRRCRWCSLNFSNFGSSRMILLIHRCSRRSTPGRMTCWAASASRLPHRMVWRYVVAVLGNPMCT